MSPRDAIVVKNTRVPGAGHAVDVLITGGRIERMSPAGTIRGEAGRTLDADGRWMLPGMWDHHVHFTQWVIRRQRVDLTTTSSAAEVLSVVQRSLRTDSRRLVGFGFRDGLWPDQPSLAALDAVSGDIPVALIAADLHCMWLNTAAQRLAGVQTDPSGVLREAASFAVMDRFGSVEDLTLADYVQTERAAAARGVVGVVDFENAENLTQWPQRWRGGVDLLRVRAAIWPQFLTEAISAGRRTGDVLTGGVTVGPLKVISDGSLNTRTAWCDEPYAGLDPADPQACGGPTVPPQQVRALMERATVAGIEVAIHAIGDRANAEVLDAFAATSAGGSVEHAQLLRREDAPRFAQLGVTASVQPEHAMDDRDVAEAYWPGRTHRAFPLARLRDAAVTLRFGSDAPVSPLDPWIQIAAAVIRSRDGRESWHPEQRLDRHTALAASTGGRTTLQEGDEADLILIEADPLSCPEDQLRSMPVALTLLAGRITHSTLV
ncbi:amidohydrolase [Nesterenkonia alba]|uniref:amidohydrolase n=1 Tax=Nesterenkonia alba TaxID=515814 RepID=UPI0003B40BA4|nr:amidohydrolase [Nesterenkonia alba]